MTRLDRYLSYVDQRGPDECWPWKGSINPYGYGQFDEGKRGGTKGAHRYGFSQFVRPLQPRETVDHVCHTRSSDCRGGPRCPHRMCQNPAHWEAVSRAENARRAYARKTHCKWGHELTPENSYGYNGHRVCKTCARLAARGQHPRQLGQTA